MTALSEHQTFIEASRDRSKRRKLSLDLPVPIPPPTKVSQPVVAPEAKTIQQRKRLSYGPAYSTEEELHSDFSQEYVNTGRRPQNFVLNASLEQRFKEYPKLQRLVQLHSALVDEYAHQATYLPVPPSSELLSTLSPMKYDCILIDPPSDWSWERIASLPIVPLAASPSFIWIWCGSADGDGLERGREVLAKWGYRRCEDIVWVKTNKKNVDQDSESGSLLNVTKEHCLMGIRGTVRRSTDAHFVHCNVDTDVIIWEGDETDPTIKPPELYTLIENFCLGNRRLQLFGNHKNLRKGWLTVGSDAKPLNDEDASSFNKEEHEAWFDPMQGGSASVPNTPEVDELRPKSPPPRGQITGQSGGGIGRGRGRGLYNPPQQPQQQGFMPPMFNPMLQPQGMNPMFGFNPMMAPFMPMPMNPMAQFNASDWTSFFQSQQQQQRR